MNSRGRRILNLVTESKPTNKYPPNEKIEDVPVSPVHYTQYTEEEWTFLENNVSLDDDFFPVPRKDGDKTFSDYLENDSHNVIFDSNEGTPMPSPSSRQDFEFKPRPTEDSKNTVSNKSIDSSVSSEQVYGSQVPSMSRTEDPIINIPSVNSLISSSDYINPDTPNSTVSTTKKRKSTYKTDPGRKRKRHVSDWVDVRRKRLTNSGKEYISKKGKTVSQKALKTPCALTCKLKCSEKFTEVIRKNIFAQYWQLCDHSKQWEFINKFTKKLHKNRKTTEGPSRRNYTTKYYLPLPTTNSNYEAQQVCLKMFCSTLSITDQLSRTAHNKLDSCGITTQDNRGKHPNHVKKINDETIKSVCDHVNSFQPIESHYTRKNTTKLYLDNSLSFNKMFSLYKDWPNLETYNSKATTERQYRNIVNDHMNIAFFMPKKDLCDKCHTFSNQENPSEDQVLVHDKHILNKETARKYKTNDKEMAIQSGSKVVCATYDFQKILNCPSGDVSIFYYKRKLSLMHFTIFDAGIKEASCYLWPQNIGKRGANEVGSCLLNFIEKKVANGAEDIRFWSDNCTGQNRNRVVYSLYMYASNKYNVDITHRFLETGHTQQEADSVHALIERSARGKIIYTPDQWYALVRWAKINNEPYHVTEVSQDMLYDLKELLQNRNFKKNTLNQDVKWNNIKEVCVKKSDPDVIFYKYDFDCDYFTLNTLVQTRRNKKTVVASCNDVLKPLYSDSLSIPEAKYKDLMHLCEAGHIPKQYHAFFKNLKKDDTNNVSGSDEDD